MSINFDENPLRENQRREYPEPKVEEHFVQGGEIVDESTTTNDEPPIQPSDSNDSN